MGYCIYIYIYTIEVLNTLIDMHMQQETHSELSMMLCVRNLLWTQLEESNCDVKMF